MQPTIITGLWKFVADNRCWKKRYDNGEESPLTDSRVQRLYAVEFAWEPKKDKRLKMIKIDSEVSTHLFSSIRDRKFEPLTFCIR